MKSKRYGIVPVSVFDADITSVDIAIYAAIATFADRRGVAYPSIPRIAKMVNSSERWVKERIKCLELSGLITVNRKIGKKNVYVLTNHPF